jgi:hypothetical protein
VWPPDDLPVELDHDRARIESQMPEQLEQCRGPGYPPALSVDGNR